MSTDNNAASTSSGSGAGDTMRAVAGLAREVEGLRMALEAVTPLPGQVKTLTAQVAPLPEQVTKLARVVKTLVEQANPEEEGKRTRPLSWLDLADGDDSDGAEAAQVVLCELSAWLVRVLLRYPDAAAAVPECWWWHPDVVEELVCLMRTWLAAYVDKDATVGRAADWHDRYRPGAIKRIKTVTANCSLEMHQDGGGLHRPGPVVPAGLALAPIALWWGSDRTSPAPVPDGEVVADARATEAAHRRNGGGR
ncbi:hypothetical protein [Amycolatopsis panacis]|uniref:DUF4913 domain-containing protein n=1 Tax=Amycolatopsis panacis TaxID=2340917 RepID=A0A419IBP5_9PSEU|nr:hypothetical protein [Amycolatopsis panacis]RJQ92380.1 hypothetical protein D5S19_01045 [Amycolatopsis panacis]